MMYDQLKRVVRAVLPANIKYKVEPLLRWLHSRAYIGTNYTCNICGTSLSKFIDFYSDKLCPRCGSSSRNRRLWDIVAKGNYLKPGATVLDFSPSRNFFRKMKKQKDVKYYPTDFENEFIAEYSFDITNLPIPNDSIDLIFCYHILEHIVEDRTAMKELFRVLRPGGICFIQTPFKDGEIYEDFTIVSPEERLIHFHQSDHVRVYSINGLVQRLHEAGFNAAIKKFNEPENNPNGFHTEECVIVCTR